MRFVQMLLVAGAGSWVLSALLSPLIGGWALLACCAWGWFVGDLFRD